MFKNLSKGEIETVFDKLTYYGLDLLGDVIEAWQYDHEEDSTILKKAYVEILEIKEHDEMDEYNTPRTIVNGLKKSLVSMTDKELKFLEDLLDLDPSEVFQENPYTDYKDEEIDFEAETVGVNPYKEISEYVSNERERRLKVCLNSSSLFRGRFKCSMSKTNQYINNDPNELFSKRFKKSMVLRNTDTHIEPYSF